MMKRTVVKCTVFLIIFVTVIVIILQLHLFTDAKYKHLAIEHWQEGRAFKDTAGLAKPKVLSLLPLFLKPQDSSVGENNPQLKPTYASFIAAAEVSTVIHGNLTTALHIHHIGFIDNLPSGLNKKQDDVDLSSAIRSTLISMTTASRVNKNDVTREATHPEAKGNVTAKYLIYLCDSGRSCGGWGDRQRGLVSAFLLANVTFRRFGINMSLPCNVINFYLPNEVNWNISNAEIRGKPYKIINSVGNYSFHNSLFSISFNDEYPEDVIFLRTNIEHYFALRGNPIYNSSLPEWATRDRSSFFRNGWNILMKLTVHMQQHVQDILREVGLSTQIKSLACAHIRIGINKSNPKDSEIRNDVRLLGPLWNFLGSYVRNGSQVFLATDSMEVRNMSKEMLGSAHHDSRAKILHIDKQRWDRGACTGFEHALLDQLLLSHCQVLVISNSGFSARAAMLRATNESLYFYNNGNITKWTLD